MNACVQLAVRLGRRRMRGSGGGGCAARHGGGMRGSVQWADDRERPPGDPSGCARARVRRSRDLSAGLPAPHDRRSEGPVHRDRALGGTVHRIPGRPRPRPPDRRGGRRCRGRLRDARRRRTRRPGCGRRDPCAPDHRTEQVLCAPRSPRGGGRRPADAMRASMRRPRGTPEGSGSASTKRTGGPSASTASTGSSGSVRSASSSATASSTTG